MRWIYISPHFDDAVLSCGGLIWEQAQIGLPVEIWTLTAGDPTEGPVSDLITRIHKVWGTGTPLETVQLRRIEDQNAANLVGAKLTHFNMVDAIYRRSSVGELLYTDDVFDPIHPSELSIVQDTAKMLESNILAADIIVCPFALGGHVDHIITRKAVESLGLSPWFYTDIPYLFQHPEDLGPATKGYQPKSMPISEEGLAVWQNSISAHKSQISSLFKDLQDMKDHISDYQTNNHGLSLWSKV